MIGVCIILFLFWCYYKKHVEEYPTVYIHSNMEDIAMKMNVLKQKIQWTPWAIHYYLQFMVYLWKSYQDVKLAKKIYSIEIIQTNDKEDLIIAWGPSSPSPQAILLFFHTLFGDYSESATFGYHMSTTHDWKPVSFSRRGHSLPLKNPVFNTVGHAKDVHLVLQKIKARYPRIPIYGVGSSAGTAVISRYMGEYGERSLIQGAVLLSPGYDFEKSQYYHYPIPDRLTMYRAKKFFLHQNQELLQKHNKKAFHQIKQATTIKEWHDTQWIFAGTYSTPRDYFLSHDPIHVIHQIQYPIVYISAMDDFMFPNIFIKRFIELTTTCKNKMIIHTKRGSHLGFYEGWDTSSWAYKVAEQFLLAIHTR